jgi:hypothetical protein
VKAEARNVHGRWSLISNYSSWKDRLHTNFHSAVGELVGTPKKTRENYDFHGLQIRAQRWITAFAE